MYNNLRWFIWSSGIYIGLLLLPLRIYAVSITILNAPESVDITEEASVSYMFKCTGCDDSYIRGVFYPDGSNYFGLTQNNAGDWIGSVSDRTQYFKIAKEDMAFGTYSGVLKIKPDSTDSHYHGTGTYQMKIGRYTASADSSAIWSDAVSILIIAPTNTPSPVPTAIPPTPTMTLKPNPTATHTPHPSSTTKPSPTAFALVTSMVTPMTLASISETTTQEGEQNENMKNSFSEVLGSSTIIESTASGALKSRSIMIALLFVALGVACMGGAYALYRATLVHL